MRAEAAQGEKGKSVIVKSVLFYIHTTWDGTICSTALRALQKRIKERLELFLKPQQRSLGFVTITVLHKSR